jgi:hypothetical protein
LILAFFRLQRRERLRASISPLNNIKALVLILFFAIPGLLTLPVVIGLFFYCVSSWVFALLRFPEPPADLPAVF